MLRPPARKRLYDFIVVGSGPSAAAWVRSALRAAPESKILLVERGPYCKTDLLTERNPLTVLRDSRRVVAKYEHGVMQGKVIGGGTAINNYAWITPSYADLSRCLGLDIIDSRTAVADYEDMVAGILGPRPPPHMLQKQLTQGLDPEVGLVTNDAIRVGASNRNKVFLGSPTLNADGARRSVSQIAPAAQARRLPKGSDRQPPSCYACRATPFRGSMDGHSTANALPCQAFTAIIDPLWRESFTQLDIVADTEISHILFEPSSSAPGGEPVAVGVQARDGEVWHSGKVVVASGALESPALLMRSGIGPEAHLRARGVAQGVVVANEHVGQHLRDKMLLDDMILTDSTLGDFDRSLLIVNRVFAGDGASVQLHRYDKSTVGNSYLALSRLFRAAQQEGGSFGAALRNMAKFLHPAGYNALCFQTYFKMQSEAQVTLSADADLSASLDASALFSEAYSREAEMRGRTQEIYDEIFRMRDAGRIKFTTTIPGVPGVHNDATQQQQAPPPRPGALAQHFRLVWHFAGSCRVDDVVRREDFGVQGVAGLHVVDMSACREPSDGGTMGMAYLTGHMAAHQMLSSHSNRQRQLSFADLQQQQQQRQQVVVAERPREWGVAVATAAAAALPPAAEVLAATKVLAAPVPPTLP
jgi:choline dehydrogenase-like flavoprotein